MAAETDKDILRLILCMKYADFCRQSRKKRVFFYGGRAFGADEAETVLELLSRKRASKQKVNCVRPYREFTREFCRFALEDEEFNAFLNMSDTRCDNCKHSPLISEKIGRQHEKYEEYRYESGNIAKVELVSCPACGSEHLQFCGIEEEMP